jgi:transposase
MVIANNDEMVPPTEVTAQAGRRRFSADYKRQIVRKADACNKTGEVGELLRREGLYSSQLTNWRQARDAGELDGLSAKKRGPKARKKNPLQTRVNELEKEVEILRAKLERAEICIDVQKKVSRLLEVPVVGEDDK